MADDIDTLLARFRKAQAGASAPPADAGDDVSAILARHRVAAAPAPAPDIAATQPAAAAPAPLSRNAQLAVQAMTPDARRQLAGLPPRPRSESMTDEELGIDQVRSTPPAVPTPALLERVFGPNPSEVRPTTNEEAARQGPLRDLYQATQDMDTVRRGVGGLGGAGLLTAAGRAVAGAAGAGPKLAPVITGATAGGLSAVGESPRDIAISTGAGGGLAAAGEAVKAGARALAPGAADRVVARAMTDVVTPGSSANLRTAKKVMERAGEEFGNVRPIFEDHPALGKALATKAATNPAKASQAVGVVMDGVSEEIAPLLERITKSTGGGRLLDISAKMDMARREAAAAGHTDVAAAIDRARTALIAQHGTNGLIPESTRLSARALQNMKNDLGRVAFAGDPSAPASVQQQAKRAIWGAVNEVLEGEAGQLPGFPLDRLRRLNRDMSVLMPIRQALDERAVKMAANRPGLGALMGKGKLATVGAIAGGAVAGAPGAVIGAAGLPAAYRGGQAIVRSVDWHLANLMRQAEAGAVQVSAIDQAIAAGLPAETAKAIAARARVVDDRQAQVQQ